MPEKPTDYTADERAVIFADRSTSPEWLMETPPLTLEERAALLSVGAGSEEDFDRRLSETDQLPPHFSWFRPDEIDWDSPLIRAVLDAMPEDTDLISAVGFLLTPQPDLELEDGGACRPVDWLAQGRHLEPVLMLAANLGAK